MALPNTLMSQTGSEPSPTARIGMVLSGTYRLDAFLGQGMTGVTYNAWHLRQKQPFAVKLLHKELAPSHDRVSRLRQDLRVLSGLRRFGFLPVDLSFGPDGAPFLAAELLVGETLRIRLSRGPLPVLAAGIVTAALARALGEAHKQQVVHGDLRPENVILPSEAGREVEAGQPVVLDGALHHLRKRAIGLDESLPLGKLAYLAPEQASGEQEAADCGGDVFALGAILYECLMGKQAFGASELEVVLEKLSSPPPALQLPRESGAPPGLSEGLDEVIRKACARDPGERYASMAEVLKGLGLAFEKTGLPLPPPDERVPIETLLSQNKALRKRTVAVKRVAMRSSQDAQDDSDVSDPSQILTAAAFSAGDAKPQSHDEKPAAKRNTAKQRVIRRTVRARDLSSMLAEVEAGRLSPEQAMALSAGQDVEEAEADEKGQPLTEEQRIAEEGRAKVLARAEAAKKNREVEVQQRLERERQETAQMQKRLLEQARAETLGRMRAEWEQSQRGKSSQSDKLAKDPATAKAEAAEQKELLEEAARQAKRIEAERLEAERRAQEDAERERKEAEAAQVARQEAERLQAELREKERLEAERAERVRQKAEREANARKAADEAEQAKQAKLAEVEAAERAAQEAKRQAEEAARLAEEAQKSLPPMATETEEAQELLEMEIDEIFDSPKKPPPVPAAVKAAAEAAAKANAEAKAAQEKAQKAKEEAEAQAVAAKLAQEAVEAAEESRMRSASEFEEIIRAAQEARDREEALAKQIREAEHRQRAAQVARDENLAKVKRATRALAVIQHVQTIAHEEAQHAPTADDSSGVVQSASMSSQRTPTGGARASLPDSATTPIRKSSSAVLDQAAQFGAPKSVPPPQDPSGVFHPSQMPPHVMRPDLVQGYTGPHMVPAVIRQEGSGPYSAPQLGALPMRPEMSGIYTNPQMAPAMLSTPMPVLMTPVIQQMPSHSPHDYTLSRGQMATALGLTAVLSGLIGSLGTLLVLRSQQQTTPSVVSSVSGTDPRVVRPADETKTTLVVSSVTPPGPAPITPPPLPADSVPVTKPSVRDAKTAFPPLRLLTEPATMPPKQSLWLRPAPPPEAGKPSEPGDVKTAAGDVKTAVIDAKVATDAKTAVPGVKTDAKVAIPTGAKTDAKPGTPGLLVKPDAKPAVPTVQPAKTGNDGLRNPFAM